MENSFVFLTNPKADRMSCDFYFISVRPDLYRPFMPHLKLYTYQQPTGRMNSKTKVKFYKKVIEEVSKE